MNTKSKIALATGAFLYISIGLYHIFLPYIWNWKEFSNLMPDMIEWALFATNFFMSFLMVLLGIATLIIVKKNTLKENKLIIYICILYWIAHILYQVVFPTPIPVKMKAMKIAFFIPSIIGFLCYCYSIKGNLKIKE